MQDLTIGLKVDVDTHVGLTKGVPALVHMLAEYGISASFYVSMGPDNSGRVVRRVFTQKGFLAKMRRTRAGSMYGWRTPLYGTLLPAPLIGCVNGPLLRWIADAGHEVGPHGWDHVRWHDYIRRMPRHKVAMEIARFMGAFEYAFGSRPLGCAAPGWQCSADTLELQFRQGLRYGADTRGHSIFLPIVHGAPLPYPQIPTTLPTLDELLGSAELGDTDPARYLLERVRPGQLNVYTLHAEVEGLSQMPAFRRLIEGLLERGARFAKLCDLAEAARADDIPPGGFEPREIPGRAGVVVCQVEREIGDQESRR
jgi:undecaprenyl phosphate-alpha-L-ara4FN deformylase